jgi:hypothetical protein
MTRIALSDERGTPPLPASSGSCEAVVLFVRVGGNPNGSQREQLDLPEPLDH